MDLALLKALSEAVGPPGDEEEVRQILTRHLAPVADELQVDPLGNLLVRRGSGPCRVMVDAHMDEVAGLVSDFAPDGFLAFKVSGGVDDRVWAGRHVWVGRQRVPGVIGVRAYHLSRDQRNDAVPQRELRIDIGARSQEEALRWVDYGDAVVWATAFEQWGDQVVKGKALDDRAGCAAVAALLTGPRYPGISLYGSFSVQEEIGLRGVRTAVAQVDPHLALVYDVTAATDYPGIGPERQSATMGAGPALSWMESSMILSEGLNRHLASLAAAAGIPFQHRRATRSGTNAGAIHPSLRGIPTAVISAPCRYLHSPAALLNVADLRGGVALGEELLRSVEKGAFHP